MKIIIGFSGGADSVALAYHLQRLGHEIIPVYINYRKFAGGGKTAKDLGSATTCAKSLKLKEIIQVRKPLGEIPKCNRNQFFIKVLASIAKTYESQVVALGTLRKEADSDLEPQILSKIGEEHGVRVITWDFFGIKEKAEEFVGIPVRNWDLIFQTTSCQMWWRTECGRCISCKDRHTAFMKSFGFDPTKYLRNPET